MRESKTAANLIAGLAAVMVFCGVMYTLLTLRGCAITFDQEAERQQSSQKK